MISLGFEVKPSPSSGQAGLSHHVSGSSRTMSPTKRSNQGASPAKQQPKPQPKREVSIAEKARIINQLKREFPNSDPNVISIAATTCEFDMDKTKELIQAFEKKSDDHQDRHKGTRVSVTSSGPTSSPSSQPTQPSQQSLFPAGLSEEIPREGQSGTFSQHGPGHSKGSATVQGGTVSRSAQPQQARAQHVTSFYFRPKQKKTRQTAVVTSQPEPQRPAAECSNRTPTVGPNQELLRGPDSSLLSSEHIQAQGPNKALRVGPDLSRVAGPQGCKGADVTLSCGPQHGLLCHQQQDRVVTPSGILVSSI
ncbi:hypothetical protein EGW08_018390 [Elysia chlorotica]|uniref:CUE domain-containing protein n=1 Tax=Elysia chlorotica TaxID=188477 RepID=A0A3S1B1H4_ELYCH|nr:hypothetical protein EGW08_018390 [Elysia chlorotica]